MKFVILAVSFEHCEDHKFLLIFGKAKKKKKKAASNVTSIISTNTASVCFSTQLHESVIVTGVLSFHYFSHA